MKVFIEGYNYPADHEVFKKYAHVYNFRTHAKGQKYCISEVGYFYDKTPKVNDCVFFLPKVLLKDVRKENSKEKEPILKVLGKYDPEEIIEFDDSRLKKTIDAKDREFIHNFSVWIFRCLNVYRVKHPDRNIVKDNCLSHIDRSRNEVNGTILEVLMALIEFHNNNRDFLLFSIRNVHSGFNKINWPKTISTKQAIKQQNGSFVYLSMVNKKKQVNNEEELLVIFYSILNYIDKRQGFSVDFDVNMELISVEQFENYRRGLGKSRLQQIKHKYFSDKSVLLWNLCYQYFDVSGKMNSSSQKTEYLLVTDFDQVFEAIIDDLIGDPFVDKVLKEQKDGKIIDHIFPYDSLIEKNRSIYYIGDSKYYMMGHEVKGTTSEYKQYTYAKNVIQYNLGLFADAQRNSSLPSAMGLQYRDSLTEGYNITPNFFISARVSSNLYDYNVSELQHRANQDSFLVQFNNRLFDRDTLWLSHYDINFLFIIALYVRNNEFAKRAFRRLARELFRANLIPVIGSKYRFYVLIHHQGIAGFRESVDMLYRYINGRVFCLDHNVPILILALERSDCLKTNQNNYKIQLEKENTTILHQAESRFFVLSDYHLGQDITSFIENRAYLAHLPEFLITEILQRRNSNM